MLHPIDYRLSKNKFWLSTWNSYSLKNYKNLILNDKILNILGYIFKNCFKVSYSFASPWSNPRKYRKYFSNFIIGFDGRRAIRTGPNKVKKLPGFIIPEDYNIIRFNNFSILKIYFLIDKNLETYWTKKQKNWRAPLKYFNMRYNNKNKNSEDNFLRLNKNLINNNIEKKNFKVTSFFIYLLNLLNNNSLKKNLYLNEFESIDFFKKDKKYLYLKFYYNNFKLLNKIRNNYFLFYLLNTNNNNSTLLNKIGLIQKSNIVKNVTSNINNIYYNNLVINIKSLSNNEKLNNNFKFLSKINYNDLIKYINLYSLPLNIKSNSFKVYKELIKNSKNKNINVFSITKNNLLSVKQNYFNNIKKYILFNEINKSYNNFKINSLFNYTKKIFILNTLKKNITHIKLNNKNNFNNFYFNSNKRSGIGLYFKNSNYKKSINSNKILFVNFKKFNKFILSLKLIKYIKDNNKLHKKNIKLDNYILNNKIKKTNFLLYNLQFYRNYKYILSFLKNKVTKTTNNSIILKKIKHFNNVFQKEKTSEYSNFQNYISILTLNNTKKINFRYKKLKNYNKLSINLLLKSFFNFKKFYNLSIRSKLLFIRKTTYSYLNNKFYDLNKFKNKNFFFSLIGKKISSKNNRKNDWGKIFWSVSNFDIKNNYNYFVKDYSLISSKVLAKKTLDKIIEYDSFLRLKKFQNSGLNSYFNKNFNFTNKVFINYNNFLNIKKIELINNNLNSSNNNNLSIYTFNKHLESINFKKIKDNNFKIINILNLSYKKTFLKFLKQQDIFSKKNLDRINYRLENLNCNKLFKLQKFKPYSYKSISKVHRTKVAKVILTNYLFNNIKKNHILNFITSMENKKYILYKNNLVFKAKNTILLNNVSSKSFFELKILNYSLNSFNKKLKTLVFLNKKIKNKDSNFILSKFKIKNFMLNYIKLISIKNIYTTSLEKLKYNYFKSQKNHKKVNSFLNNLYIKPYKFLLFNKSNNLRNYNSNFLINFKKQSFKKIKYSSLKLKNIYKYKLNIYNYLNVNKKIELKQLYIPTNWNNKKISLIIPLTLKKSSLLYHKSIYNKSNNLEINKYIKTRLYNVFLSKKVINKKIKNNKLKSENFNFRIYGLVKKLSDVKPLNKKDFKKINTLEPKTFFYWKHLKWFNLFIKTKFNFKFNTNYNFYSIFKVYENYKNLNFSYYKNFKQSYNSINYNSFSSFKYNYKKLNHIIFYSTILKSKLFFLNTKFQSKKNKQLYKSTLLSNWSHDIMFFSSSSKRLNYIPHLRLKSIKDSIFMWRIDLRKLNLLSRYYKARTKFYKNKLNFVSNYNTRTQIINYLKVMESNFIRIKKSMQRDLPLIYTKRYLLTQFKKLNSYIKVLLRRQKKRINYNIKKQYLNINKKFNKLDKSIFLSKDTEILSKKLFNFVSKRFFLGKKNFIDYVKKFIEHLFLVIFKFNNLRLFYIKKYQINIMSTKAKLFKNLFNYRLATGFKIPFLVKVICKKLNFDKSLVGCKIGFFGRYSKKLRNRKIWKYVKHLKPSVISTPLDYYNILILQKWGITGIKLSILKKKTFNFIFI